MLSNPSNVRNTTTSSPNFNGVNRPRTLGLSGLLTRIQKQFSPLVVRPGVHTATHLAAMGFQYTDPENTDTARCEQCGLEVSGWTLAMQPWNVHSTQRPNCPFVRSLRSEDSSNEFSSLSLSKNVKRKKIEAIDLESPLNTSVEADLFREAQKRTYSEWPHSSTLPTEQMIRAGFLACNVGDRVVCIHCDCVCAQWTPHADEPCEVHRTLSPQCQYVQEKLLTSEQPRIINRDQKLNSDFASNRPSVQNIANTIPFIPVVRSSVGNSGNRDASPSSDSLSPAAIEEKIRAGYSPIEHDKNCADCQKSLQDMGSCDSAITDLARWLVHCVHTKQFNADQVYHAIQECEREKRECAENKASSHGVSNTSRTVPTRLNLSIPPQLLGRNFSLTLLQRIWGNELRFKPDDSFSDVHLLLSCFILQKQTDQLGGDEGKIQTPGLAMRRIRVKAEDLIQRRVTAWLANGINSGIAQSNSSMPANPCFLCCEKEKQLACIPCGHLVTCISCGQSLRACPICQREITAFIRIYI